MFFEPRSQVVTLITRFRSEEKYLFIESFAVNVNIVEYKGSSSFRRLCYAHGDLKIQQDSRK